MPKPSVVFACVEAAPSADLIEVLGFIKTEIGAGMVLKLGPINEAERAHNNACERANRIIQKYIDGFGLFQMTRKQKEATPHA